MGWFSAIRHINSNAITPLRLDGYKFTRPLLACDTEQEITSEKTREVSNKVKDYISSQKDDNHITTASVYVRDYKDGATFNINPDEKYWPASLNKIPVMITAYKTTKEKKNFLDERYNYSYTEDFNKSAEVKPSAFISSGHTYSIQEALNRMIINSDNNALYFLTSQLDNDMMQKTYQDLKIPLGDDSLEHVDFLTAKEFSYFLRVLYNSTYIDKDLSEKALELLSKVKYKNGLVAGVPQNITVAHKFGIRTMEENGGVNRELHDCGFVYRKDKPYLICVMTKNKTTLQDAEETIKGISQIVYEGLR